MYSIRLHFLGVQARSGNTSLRSHYKEVSSPRIAKLAVLCSRASIVAGFEMPQVPGLSESSSMAFTIGMNGCICCRLLP